MHLSSQNVNSITVSKALNHFGWGSFFCSEKDFDHLMLREPLKIGSFLRIATVIGSRIKLPFSDELCGTER